MKIAILSDSHDNVKNIEKFLEEIKKEGIKEIIHLGDLCAPFMLKILLAKFDGKIHLTFGNVEGDEWMMTKFAFESNSRATYYKPFGEIEIDSKKIAFVHYPEFAKGFALGGNYDAVFYGHNHQQKEEQVGKTLLVNPGNTAGVTHEPGFAIYDTEENKVEFRKI